MPQRFVFLAGMLAAGTLAAAQTPGEAVFNAHCARCHGIGGAGGEGPSLARAVLPRAGDDEALASIITDGIPDTDMPGNWILGAREVEALVDYVRSLGRVEPAPVPGNPERGKAIFEGRGGCGICHIVGGEGGTLGPDLSAVGARRGAAYLKDSLIAPGKNVLPRYVVVRAVTADGRLVEGLRVNEDSFTVQVRDETGRYHSLDKMALQSLEKKLGTSLMPSYAGELSASEVEDVVAYLVSLRGE